MQCATCGRDAPDAFSVKHRECGHKTCVDCAESTPLNFKKCSRCLGNSEVVEPKTQDGIDYVLNPGQKQSPSLLGSALSIISRKQDMPQKSTIDLLKSHIAIPVLMQRHQIGLQHMLRDGIVIDDFLVNDYGIDDLSIFEDISKRGPKRSLDAFVRGLGVTANHLRDHPDKLPMDKFSKLTNVTKGQICTHLGLHFPDGGPLMCFNDDNWNAVDCVNIGLTMHDLIQMGLQYNEQYDDLMRDLTVDEQRDAQRALKVTKEHIATLKSFYTEPELEPEPVQEKFYDPPPRRSKPIPVPARQQPRYLKDGFIEKPK